MSRDGIEKALHQIFMKLIQEEKGNVVNARNRLNYLIFHKFRKEFENLNENDQWVVRNYINAIDKLYQ